MIKNKEMWKEKAIAKWKPVFQKLGWNENIEKFCEYAETHALYESSMSLTAPITDNIHRIVPVIEDNMLPKSLQVLKQIHDLSKVHLVGAPVFEMIRDNGWVQEVVKTYACSVDVLNGDMYDLISGFGLNVLTDTENLLINELSDNFNKLIEEGCEIYMFIAAEAISVINEKAAPTSRIMIRSRYHIERPSVKLEKATGITMEDL